MESAVSKETKTCTKCREEKPRSEFHMVKCRRDGLSYTCRDCTKEYQAAYRKRSKAKPAVIPEFKACPLCGATKPASAFYTDRYKATGLRSRCIACELDLSMASRPKFKDKVSAYNKKYRQRPDIKLRAAEYQRSRPEEAKKYRNRYIEKPGVKEKLFAYRKEYSQRPEVRARVALALREYRKTAKYKEWRKKNIERIREQARESSSRRRATVRGLLNNRISRAINAKLRDGKQRKRAFDVVGYSADDLRLHLERQFMRGMTWAKFLSGDIHIDHIVPVSSFTITSMDDPELRACWALSNLRPMWAKKNIEKGARREHLL